MPIARFQPSAEAFQSSAGHWLALNEAENSLLLGITSNLLSKTPAQRQDHFFWTVEEAGELIGAAGWTPPYKLTLTEMDEASLAVLAEQIRQTHSRLPGVGGPVHSSKRFAQIWNRGAPKALHQEHMRIYRLEKVARIPLSPGSMRLAGEEQTDRLVEWTKELNREVGITDSVEPRTIVEGYLREKRLFIWDNEGYRAMAGYGRSTPRTHSVNMVFTPSEERRKGYASSLVAQLSQKLLDSGKKYCLLYTDLENPTSNHIYQNLGFRPVCDWRTYRFG